ncbi:hypothetical protein FCIRC_4947 [Fusarium circinatum]|uniref:Uncharacterized protein n=1 Tax=Fusarium circinatum TaxID=48490 RepID=A0A8H5U7R3_FUSCI|nr:hypothetical protein FCIRC_4947 [Fusarium circinatum]
MDYHAVIDRAIPTKNLTDRNVANDLLLRLSRADLEKSYGIIYINLLGIPPYIWPSQNGFIWAASEVFDKQRGLTIQVDHIWLAGLALMKPLLHEAFGLQEDQEIPAFTQDELKDEQRVANCLTDMVKVKFCPEVSDLLMPDFSTTTPQDSVAAALILLGTTCPGQNHRTFDQRLEPNDRKPIEVLGAKADWKKLQETFLKLSLECQDTRRLADMIWRLDDFVDKLLRAGYQLEYPAPRLTANELNPGP